MSKFHSRLKKKRPLNIGNRGIGSTLHSTEVRHRHPRTEFWRISENLHAYQKILKKMPAYSEWHFFMFFIKFIQPIIFYIHRSLHPILPKIEKWGFLSLETSLHLSIFGANQNCPIYLLLSYLKRLPSFMIY